MSKELHEHQHEHEDECCCCEHDHHEHEHHEHEHHHHDDDCCCGHDHHEHEHDDDCCCGHDHHDHEHHHHEVQEDHSHDHDFDHIARDKQRIYIIEGLDCANCAAKMERKIQAMSEIQAATITFATKQLRFAADDPERLVPQLEKACQTIESEVTLVAKDMKPVSREKKEGIWSEHKNDLISIISGAVLFAAGLIADHAMGAGTGVLLPIFLIGYVVLGLEVLWTSAKNISKGQVFDENFLMSVATIAAFCIGDFAEGVGVMLFYKIGELFEDIAVDRSRSQIMDAVDMRPETVNRIHGDEIENIPAEDAKIGDLLQVRPGDRIPLDGIVTEGESRIDTSPVTGEPVPVTAKAGTEVISGCVNEQGLLKIKVTKPLAESMVTRILDSVENAAAGKPKIDKFITKFAKVYTPIVVILAVLTAIIPSLITGNWSEWITTAITFLVISCPCALVISVPLAFFAGIGAGSKLGILFKGGISIEALKNVKAIVMDKTGTITKGNFVVQNITPADDQNEDQIIAIAAACEAGSTHPIALSIMEEAAKCSATIQKASEVEEISGKGIRAQLTEGEALCGNRKLMDQFGIDISRYESGEGTEIFLALNGRFAGHITIADTIKSDAVDAIAAIKANGLIPAMLTGDAAGSANAVARTVGIAESNVHAQLLPEDKLNTLKDIRNQNGAVMFVGDGINDAPVLAGADVGAAMGSGADAAIEAADVVFMNSSVKAIPQAISIAKATGSISMQNVIFALAIKLLVLVLGFIGFANIWAAVFADTGVAMLCILNSMRILLKKFK